MTNDICSHCGQDHALGHGPECPANPVYGPVVWSQVSGNAMSKCPALEAGSFARVGHLDPHATCNRRYGWTATIIDQRGTRPTVVRQQLNLRDERAAIISA